eukprot:4794892-Amphidinium_carterae.1
MKVARRRRGKAPGADEPFPLSRATGAASEVKPNWGKISVFDLEAHETAVLSTSKEKTCSPSAFF